MIVLIMLFTQPVFQVKTYQDLPTASDQALLYLKDIFDSNQSWSDYQYAAQQVVDILGKNQDYPAILIEIPDYNKAKFNNDSLVWQ